MSNEAQTYHLLITLPLTYGEEADAVVEATEAWLQRHENSLASVVHLTPETLPDRYIERAEVREILRQWERTIISDAHAVAQIDRVIR
jgi:hypothetical protein